MNANLYAEMKRFGVSVHDIQSAIGKTEKTVFNKLSGRTEFTFPETVVIRDSFFPSQRLEYLFAPSVKAKRNGE